MVLKILYLEIKCCSECPYCQYDPHYSMGQDAGVDCLHDDAPRTRIVNEGNYKSSQMRNIIDSEIPEWCPLENKENNNE